MNSYEKVIFHFIFIIPIIGILSDKKLVWSDKFSYKGLPDSTKWNFEKGFVRNKEPQYYTEHRLANARVEGGKLLITANELLRSKLRSSSLIWSSLLINYYLNQS